MDEHANSQAQYYTWYMTGDYDARIVAYEWWPEGQKIEADTSLGQMIFKRRANAGDVWDSPMSVAIGITWKVAQTMCKAQGFDYEVPVIGPAGDPVES